MNLSFSSFRIYGYAATWTADEVYILGGYYSKDQATIAKYSNGAWSDIGKLVQGRYSHAAISHDGINIDKAYMICIIYFYCKILERDTVLSAEPDYIVRMRRRRTTIE